MINTGNLRKGNWVRTEFGICKVAFVIWGDVYVYAKDNRTNYAREVEGIGIGEFDVIGQVGESLVAECLKTWLFIHELQNWYYWKTGKYISIYLNNE